MSTMERKGTRASSPVWLSKIPVCLFRQNEYVLFHERMDKWVKAHLNGGSVVYTLKIYIDISSTRV